MVTKQRKVTWDKQAIDYFKETIKYIRKDSPKNADKVKQQIFKKIREVAKHPEIHNPDKYKIDNNGDYRAFELHRLRIGYLVEEDEIIIARVRSTNQEPLNY